METREYESGKRSGSDTGYWNVLCQVFNGLGIEPNRKESVLAVRCGRLTEGVVLSEVFNKGNIHAIDTDGEKIKVARKNNPHLVKKQIITGDARDIQRHFQKKFDIITLRHPQPIGNTKTWEKILSASIKQIEKNGLLIMTTFSRMEVETMLRTCMLMAIKIPFIGFNQEPDPRSSMDDAYICVIQNGGLISDLKQRILAFRKLKSLPKSVTDKACDTLDELI